MPKKPKSDRRVRTWEAMLLAGALAAAIFSTVFSQQQEAYETVAARAIPVKATLRLIEVKEWIPGQGNWSAFGKFDVVADEKLGTLEGDLAPRKPRKRGKRTREEAEALKDGWKIGQTYDGFWNPDRPLTVFFAKPDPIGNAQATLGLQILAAVLFLCAMVLNLRRRCA